MKRRNFLTSLAAAFSAYPALGLFSTRLAAVEAAGEGWTKKWIVYYSNALIEWARADLEKRAALVRALTEIAVPLNFQYFHGKLSRKDELTQKEFLAGRLSDQATIRHIDLFLADIEAVRKEVAAKEAEAVGKWKEEKQPETSVTQGKIYGSDVSARYLGVILDNSGSMKRYVEKLRTEINRDFGGCHIVEVDGCQLLRTDGEVPWFYAAPVSGVNPFTPERHCPSIPQNLPREKQPYQAYYDWLHDTASAIAAMAILMKLDAIYWFSDFEDRVDDEAVRKIAAFLLERKVKLYLHTIGKPPAKLLALLAEKSGGKAIRKAVR